MVTRLELPHLERYAVDSAHRVCFTSGWASEGIPTPVESANNPFASCAADHIQLGAKAIEYDIVAPVAAPPERTPATTRPTPALSAVSGWSWGPRT
jgi:hypothetical protein